MSIDLNVAQERAERLAPGVQWHDIGTLGAALMFRDLTGAGFAQPKITSLINDTVTVETWLGPWRVRGDIRKASLTYNLYLYVESCWTAVASWPKNILIADRAMESIGTLERKRKGVNVQKTARLLADSIDESLRWKLIASAREKLLLAAVAERLRAGEPAGLLTWPHPPAGAKTLSLPLPTEVA